jgi:hypothetical protein
MSDTGARADAEPPAATAEVPKVAPLSDAPNLEFVPCPADRDGCRRTASGALLGWRVALEGIVGSGRAAPPLHGVLGGGALSFFRMFDEGEVTSFGPALRLQYLGGSGQMRDTNSDGQADVTAPPRHSLAISGGGRLVWGLDPVQGQSWVLDLGGGYMRVLGESAASSGPFVDVMLGTQASWLGGLTLIQDPVRPAPFVVGRRGDYGIGLRVQQGLAGAADYRALLATLWVNDGEFVLPARPSLLVPRDPSFDYTFGVAWSFLGFNASKDLFGGGFLPQVALVFGMPLPARIDLRLHADFMYIGIIGHGISVQYTGLAGLRVNLGALFLEGAAGYAFAYGIEPLAIGSGPVADAGFGIRSISCAVSGGAGFRGRFGLTPESESLRMLTLAVFLEYDTAAYRASRGSCKQDTIRVEERWDLPPLEPAAATPLATPLPPPSAEPPTPPSATPVEIFVVPVGADVIWRLDQGLPPPPGWLPMQRLTGAREVRVEIRAPHARMAQVESALRTSALQAGLVPPSVTYRPSPFGPIELAFFVVR